jgi:4-hydroxy-4-methyl-2-oxoglutarate aldolase
VGESAVPGLDELRPRLFGGVPESLIARLDFPRLDPADLGFLREQADPTCVVADVLDASGVGAYVPGTHLPPLAVGQRVCGQAVTLRYEPYGGVPATHRRLGSPALAGDRDLYALAGPGDVAVISAAGQVDAAVLGDISLGFAQVAGIGGVIVDGAVRDVETLRSRPVPVWARGASPMAARYRWAAAELNGPVNLAGARVHPGDLVVADGNGVCVVPLAEAAAVVAECRRLVAAEDEMSRALAEAKTLSDLVARVRGSAVL